LCSVGSTDAKEERQVADIVTAGQRLGDDAVELVVAARHGYRS
jgi:hypothetical protein